MFLVYLVRGFISSLLTSLYKKDTIILIEIRNVLS